MNKLTSWIEGEPLGSSGAAITGENSGAPGKLGSRLSQCPNCSNIRTVIPVAAITSLIDVIGVKRGEAVAVPRARAARVKKRIITELREVIK
jgi:hypothetical protein